jgi:hypothetical protein
MLWRERLLRHATWLAAGFVVVVAAGMIVAPAAMYASGIYSYWLHGYEDECVVRTISDTPSPTGRWTARLRRGNCADFGSGPWVDIVLIPNDRPQFLARRRQIFYRDLENPVKGGDQIAITWIDDYALEVRTPPCAPRCNKWDDQRKAFVPTGFDPCEAECRNIASQSGVRVSMKSSEN